MMQGKLSQGSFLLLLLFITALFAWILLPFSGAILWAAVSAILFYPVKRRWEPKFGPRKNLLALCVLLLCTLIVILPLLFIGASLAQEGSAFYQKVSSGEIKLDGFFSRLRDSTSPLQRVLGRFGVDLGNINQQATDAAVQASRYLATQALSIGQNTAQFVVSFVLMLYLTFFFLRDGEHLVQLSIRALPLGDARERILFTKLSEVINATVKGNLVVAVVQGSLGAFIFWVLGVQGALLWGTVMAVASLLPSVGSALIWFPVALYFLLTGAIWQGVVLIGFGAGVIGLVDNLLRPILVGRSTQIPDYMVLLSTLGGIAIFGLNGFVVGPLIAALFIAFWDMFIREFNP